MNRCKACNYFHEGCNKVTPYCFACANEIAKFLLLLKECCLCQPLESKNYIVNHIKERVANNETRIFIDSVKLQMQYTEARLKDKFLHFGWEALMGIKD